VLLCAALFCAGLLLWTRTPGYRRATIVAPSEESDIKVYGHADFHAIHRLGIVAGTVHRDGCLLEGVSRPDNSMDIVKELVTALRAQGLEVTEAQARPLVTYESEAKPNRPCTQVQGLGKQVVTYLDDWAKISYPPIDGLTQGMSALPFDAVLVVGVVSAEAAPYSDGTLLFGTVSPAMSHVGLGAQLIAKDGSVPWSAEVNATGQLRHPGIHLMDSGPSGPAPEIEPVRKAAIARLAVLMKHESQ
jgi:hypothetical protein